MEQEVGRFSRRHKTREAHDKERRRRADRQAAKVRRAQERQEEADSRLPRDQIDRLDERLGLGVGAAKERARLEKALRPKR